MPAGKKQDAITLTFSRKNKDILKFLQNKKCTDPTFIATDFICEAIRFYNKNKDSIDSMNVDTINKIIEMKLATLNVQQQDLNEEVVTIEEKFYNRNMLESNIEDIDIDED